MAVETKRELISRAEYARRKGVAAQMIGKYCQRKIIPLHDNLIDPEEADKELARILIKPLGAKRVSAKGMSCESSNGEQLTNSYVEARTREKQLKVELLELDLQLKKGEMVLTKDAAEREQNNQVLVFAEQNRKNRRARFLILILILF